MSMSIRLFKGVAICSLFACVSVASAQTLQSRSASRTSSAVASGISKEQQDEAELLAKLKDATLENRIKRIIGEPCPIGLADVSFSNAVVMAKSGDADGYFALSLHYSKGMDVERDADKAWQLLRKSADMGCPIATLFYAMAEELRIYGLSEDYNGDPDFRMYITNSQVYCEFRPFAPVTDNTDSARDGVRRGLLAIGARRWDDPGYSVTNQTQMAYVREWYEKAIALGASGARGELERFDNRMAEALSEIAERERAAANNREAAAKERDRQLSNAEFVKGMLDIPVESKASVWQKNRKEKESRLPSLEERVTALEKRLEKEER